MLLYSWTTTFLLMTYVIVILPASVALMLENRQPAKTLAWLLVMLLVPYVGVGLFFFFGRNQRKERFISLHTLDMVTRRSMAHFEEQRSRQLPSNYKELITQFTKQNVALPYNDNEIDVYTSGYDFFPALLAAIQSAKDHIHLVTYIFDDDALGRLVADALIDKARQGVKVKVIYDDVGCWRVKDRLFENMSRNGVDVRAFMPVLFPAFTSKINYRLHRKICVIDGNVGFIGGMNIAIRYVKGSRKQPWRDTHVRVRGKAVYGLQTAFLVDWHFTTDTIIDAPNYFPTVGGKAGGSLAQVVMSDPISQWPELEQGYVRVLLEAKKYVYLESPYFLPTETVMFALRTCALAGVDVRIIVPRHTDSKLVEWASRSYFDEMLEAGVKIFLYMKGFNHSKLMVCDDNICTCGSANIDIRSFENNFEANIFFYDEATVAKIKQVVENDLGQSELLDVKRFMHRPFPKRLWESVIRLLSPLL